MEGVRIDVVGDVALIHEGRRRTGLHPEGHAAIPVPQIEAAIGPCRAIVEAAVQRDRAQVGQSPQQRRKIIERLLGERVFPGEDRPEGRAVRIASEHFVPQCAGAGLREDFVGLAIADAQILPAFAVAEVEIERVAIHVGGIDHRSAQRPGELPRLVGACGIGGIRNQCAPGLACRGVQLHSALSVRMAGKQVVAPGPEAVLKPEPRLFGRTAGVDQVQVEEAAHGNPPLSI